jgi:hypothetical protein
MKESKLLYAMTDHEDFMALMWETELGNILTVEGKLDIKNNIDIRGIDGNDINNVDLRNVLMSILPRK